MNAREPSVMRKWDIEVYCEGTWAIQGTVYKAWHKAESLYVRFGGKSSVTLYRYGHDGKRWECYTIKPYSLNNRLWAETGF